MWSAIGTLGRATVASSAARLSAIAAGYLAAVHGLVLFVDGLIVIAIDGPITPYGLGDIGAQAASAGLAAWLACVSWRRRSVPAAMLVVGWAALLASLEIRNAVVWRIWPLVLSAHLVACLAALCGLAGTVALRPARPRGSSPRADIFS